jgi:tetratricopeptide (TPR) repeat protein
VAKKNPNTAANALRDIEESGDRFAEWAAEHAAVILGAIAAILVLAAGVGLYFQHGTDTQDEAADALALASSQYRLAMGADPAGGAIVEPANPELAEQTRTRFADRFIEVAEEHAGTPAASIAWLEAGNLQAELGRPDAAASSFEAAHKAGGNPAVSALASTRLAGLAEDRGDAAAAAEAYEAAGRIAEYPLAGEALTDAARCWVEAGETDRALAVYQHFEAEHPDAVVTPQIESLIAELRLRR